MAADRGQEDPCRRLRADIPSLRERERLFSERRRSEAMSTFSGRKNSGMEIPDYAIERIARCLLPMIQAYYESDEGQAELAAWNEKKDAEDAREHERQTA